MPVWAIWAISGSDSGPRTGWAAATAALVLASDSSISLPIRPPLKPPTAAPMAAPAPVWPVALPTSAPGAPRQADHRRQLSGRGAEQRAGAGVEARLRPGRPAVGLHGHPDLAGNALPPRPPGRPAGLRRPPPHDAHGAAGSIPAGRFARG